MSYIHQQQQQQQQNYGTNYRHHSQINNINPQMMLEVKSKYDAEFRRIGLNRHDMTKFDEFYSLIERLHGLNGIQFNICYTDKDGDMLPINNDMNLARVLQVTIGILRLIIQRKGECYASTSDYQQHHQQGTNNVTNGTNVMHNGTSYSYSVPYNQQNNLNHSSSNSSYRAASNLISQIKSLKELSTTLTNSSLSSSSSSSHHHPGAPKGIMISHPEDFRPVSAIIDVDILPDTYRRVRLHKHKSSKPLGFYIRDGRSLRVTPQGVEQVPGIFISRLMPGGLAESTGLLSVNDEVVEVNGIEVAGKTLDQVTDMMVANSSNLIITVKPTNQRYNLNRATTTANTTSNSNNSNSSMTGSSSSSAVQNNNNFPAVHQNQLHQQQQQQQQQHNQNNRYSYGGPQTQQQQQQQQQQQHSQAKIPGVSASNLGQAMMAAQLQNQNHNQNIYQNHQNNSSNLKKIGNNSGQNTNNNNSEVDASSSLLNVNKNNSNSTKGASASGSSSKSSIHSRGVEDDDNKDDDSGDDNQKRQRNRGNQEEEEKEQDDEESENNNIRQNRHHPNHHLNDEDDDDEEILHENNTINTNTNTNNVANINDDENDDDSDQEGDNSDDKILTL